MTEVTPTPTTPTTPTTLTSLTATQLLQGYRAGQFSVVEATQAFLNRIEHFNPSLNAFCLIDAEAALASAQRSDARWQAHRQLGAPIGALEGVPMAIKDLILTRGWPTLRGSRTVAVDQDWSVDAPVVARLRESGAVLVGKTTTPEFGCKGETNSPLTGITRNPWNLARTSGGSSGGSSAAVSAGMVPVAIGTDGAGSVRIPAAFCGNVGFKPSFGRVPAYPLSPFGSVAHLGPHAMSVADIALTMNVAKQPDARDWTSLPEDRSDYGVGLNDGVRGMRIAYSPTLGYVKNLDPEIRSALDQVARVFESLGALVDAVDPGFEDPLEITTGLWFAAARQVYDGLSGPQQTEADPDFQAQAELGSRITAADLHSLNLRRGLLGSQMRQFMQGFDLLLTPAISIPAFAAEPAGHRPMDPQAMLGWTPYSYPFNLTQQPAISIPCGLTRGGLPMALQLVGPMFGDALVLRAARAYESLYPAIRPCLTEVTARG